MAYKINTVQLALFLVFMLSAEACVETFKPDLDENDSKPMLVVDGQITNEEGPFRVKLTSSTSVDVYYYVRPILEADVSINDDKGNVFQLIGDSCGNYETAEKNLKCIPGNSYTLFVTTKDGVKYESSPVFVENTPDIDSVYFENDKRTRFVNNEAFEDNWLNILLDTHDPDGNVKYWRYEFEETWKIELVTDNLKILFQPPVDMDNTKLDFYRADVIVSDEKKAGWVTKPSTSILIASTANKLADELKRFPIQSLGPRKDKLHIKYSILVKQSSISFENYNYLKRLKDANENVGGIYNKIPSRVFGNISCINGTAKVLGYFSASVVKKKRIFIAKAQHQVETVSAYDGCKYRNYWPSWLPPIIFGTDAETGEIIYSDTKYCADCGNYGSIIKPDFWE